MNKGVVQLEQGAYQVTVDLGRLQVALSTHNRNPGKLLSRIPQKPGFVNYATLAQKAKVFDDRMLAALELSAWRVKGPWLLELAARVGHRAPLLAACCSLWGREDWSSDQSNGLLRAFLKDEGLSKPLGFYAGNPELEGIYQRDRLLQSSLDESEASLLQKALQASPLQLACYQELLQLQARLTGPPSEPSDLLSASPEQNPALFPPSRSPEARLARELLGTLSVPPHFQLLDELIAAVQSGRLSLQPESDSGLYERQLWSLEPLLLPPDPKLILDEEYLSYRVELFKGLFCMTRETHIKQLPPVSLGSDFGEPQLRISIPAPELSLEPIAGSYRRRAESYAFLSWTLAQWSASELTEMAREVDQMTGIFHGAYLTVCRELGMASEPLPLRDAHRDLKFYSEFAGQRQTDPDLQVESRLMVPLFYDQERRQHKVLLFMGWQEQPLYLFYESRDWHNAVTVTHRETGELCQNWSAIPNARESTLLCPKTLEVFTPRLLNRKEFCDLCWTAGSLEGVIQAISEP